MAAATEHQFDIFLSYSRQDRDLLSDLVRMLRGASRTVFQDVEELKGGDQFPDKLHEALQASHIIACCWSPAFFQSRWCLHEARYALKREKLLPLVIAPLDTIDLPPDLENANYFDLTTWDGDFDAEIWQAVSKDIKKRLPVPLSGIAPEKQALFRFIYELPFRHHAATEANDDRLGSINTYDMMAGLIDIADTLGRYWQQLKRIESGYNSNVDWAKEFKDRKQAIISSLPPYDPHGGTIQKIERASSVQNAVAGMVIEQVESMMPENDIIDFKTWARHFMQAQPLPPLRSGN
ncbi:toll/interleukin-1 receptor domain-containing protein [Hyphomonas sp.]|uniref:toll/interleukin-1 receptor domain-containing protein n=1 Tax=Hyphomonas sp. TaxID=87 RepID=UPI003562997F